MQEYLLNILTLIVVLIALLLMVIIIIVLVKGIIPLLDQLSEQKDCCYCVVSGLLIIFLAVAIFFVLFIFGGIIPELWMIRLIYFLS